MGDLKHIEELAEDKDLIYAMIVRYFKDYDVDCFEHEEKVKYFKDLTDTQKINLIGSAYYYWLKAEIDTSLGLVCDCVMSLQFSILHHNITNMQFWNKLSYMI